MTEFLNSDHINVVYQIFIPSERALEQDNDDFVLHIKLLIRLKKIV